VSKLIKAKKIGYKITRYYPIYVKANESNILDHMMHPTRRKIIFFLLEHGNCKFKEIVPYLNRARSTTSFQLSYLRHAGISCVLKEGHKNNQFYRLKNRARIVKTASKYQIRLYAKLFLFEEMMG
jgi:DNA-binding transcriptional ArsR family regulator